LAHRSSIALVLLDVIRPRRGGPEVFEAIQAMKPGVPVVFATGYSNETAALTEMVERGIAVLRKPYRPRGCCAVVFGKRSTVQRRVPSRLHEIATYQNLSHKPAHQ
jgi:DNA-binding NtrC family response regulator